MPEDTIATPPAEPTVQAPESTEPMLKPEPEATPPAEGNGLLNPEPGADKGEAKPEEPAKGEEDGESKPEEKKAPEGAPEKYGEFTLPEGVALEGEMLEEVHGLFHDLNLTQENAQKLVDYFSKRQIADKERMVNDLADKRKEWQQTIRSRPEFSSERALARKGLSAVVKDPEERALFDNTWLSDHPALWNIFVRIGRLVGEDTPMQGTSRAPEVNVNELRFPVGKRKNQ